MAEAWAVLRDGSGRVTPDAGRRTPDAGRRTPDAGRHDCVPVAGTRKPAID